MAGRNSPKESASCPLVGHGIRTSGFRMSMPVGLNTLEFRFEGYGASSLQVTASGIRLTYFGIHTSILLSMPHQGFLGPWQLT